MLNSSHPTDSPADAAAGRQRDLAQAVRDRRTALGWNTAELARRAGMSTDLIDSIEAGEVTLTLDLVEELATALESTVRLCPHSAPRFSF
jgi:ribosome-binding protein aMBF1 (putative translation factor)